MGSCRVQRCEDLQPRVAIDREMLTHSSNLSSLGRSCFPFFLARATLRLALLIPRSKTIRVKSYRVHTDTCVQPCMYVQKLSMARVHLQGTQTIIHQHGPMVADNFSEGSPRRRSSYCFPPFSAVSQLSPAAVCWGSRGASN